MVKRSVALLIPAHNEELVIKNTILAANAAGFACRDIYVVNDSSEDKTYEIANEILKNNVVSVKRGGKGEALKFGAKHFKLLDKYNWITMTDADTILDKDFRKVLDEKIRTVPRKDIVAICGQVRTMKGRWISHYRSFEYALGQDFYKRVEGLFNMILVLPGCGSCFNTMYMKEIKFLDLVHDTLVEDYDLTIEFHYKTKGKIVYVPEMIVWTQEPINLKVYTNQIRRWYRGWFQVARKRLSLKPKKVDMLIYFFSLDTFFFAVELFAIACISIIKQNPIILSELLILDFLTIFALALYAAIAKKRPEIIGAFPLIYGLRYLNIYFFIKAGFDVYVLNKAPLKTTAWNTPRYQISA